MITAANAMLAAIAILITANKADKEENRRLDDEMEKLRSRVCALEIIGGAKQCGEKR